MVYRAWNNCQTPQWRGWKYAENLSSTVMSGRYFRPWYILYEEVPQSKYNIESGARKLFFLYSKMSYVGKIFCVWWIYFEYDLKKVFSLILFLISFRSKYPARMVYSISFVESKNWNIDFWLYIHNLFFVIYFPGELGRIILTTC